MDGSVMLNKLDEFMSTQVRKDVLKCYVIKDSSQSDVVTCLDKMKPQYGSTSTVDRITSSLNYIGIIDKEDIKENKQYYRVNWHIWIQETLKSLGLKNVSEEKVAEIEKLVSDKKMIAFYFALTSEDVLKTIWQEKLDKVTLKELKKEGIQPEIFLNYMIKQGPGISHLPFFFILSGNPMAKLWAKDMKDTKKTKEKSFIKALNDAILKDPAKEVLEKFDDKVLKEIIDNMRKIEEATKKLFIEQLKEQMKS